MISDLARPGWNERWQAEVQLPGDRDVSGDGLADREVGGPVERKACSVVRDHRDRNVHEVLGVPRKPSQPVPDEHLVARLEGPSLAHRAAFRLQELQIGDGNAGCDRWCGSVERVRTVRPGADASEPQSRHQRPYAGPRLGLHDHGVSNVVAQALPLLGEDGDEETHEVARQRVHDPEQVAQERGAHRALPAVHHPHLHSRQGLAESGAESPLQNPCVEEAEEEGCDDRDNGRLPGDRESALADPAPTIGRPHPGHREGDGQQNGVQHYRDHPVTEPRDLRSGKGPNRRRRVVGALRPFVPPGRQGLVAHLAHRGGVRVLPPAIRAEHGHLHSVGSRSSVRPGAVCCQRKPVTIPRRP